MIDDYKRIVKEVENNTKQPRTILDIIGQYKAFKGQYWTKQDSTRCHRTRQNVSGQ